MKRRLTALNVTKLPKPATGQIEYSDPDLQGFALRVSASAVRSYVLRYVRLVVCRFQTRRSR